MEALNLGILPRYLSDEHEAWALLERRRWPDGAPVCPHCGAEDAAHYFISAKSGERKTKTGNVTYRRLWRCRDKACRMQFSVLVGTVFESAKLPASKSLLALWLMSAGQNGTAALELERHLGVAHQTAWFIGHRLREAMRREPLVSLLSGAGRVRTAEPPFDQRSRGGPVDNQPEPSEDEEYPRPQFEEVLMALLKVDPTGIAGKHRRAKDAEDAG